METALPIDAALPAVLAGLAAVGQAVLQAPPGAGKTTRVPLALWRSGQILGRIVMLEPRRLAARAAAARMADSLAEPVGRTVGYRIRGESRGSAVTRIEVVTEAILTRMIQDDPGLDGIGAVIFDEFHERSLHADLGLALALEARAALRPDLRLLVMSATLDAAPVAALMGGAPVVTAEGRAHPVETRWLPRPLGPGVAWDAAMAAQIAEAAEAVPQGGVLAFLPGEAEIRRVERLLQGRLAPGTLVSPLFGAMEFSRQQAVLAPPPPGGRRVVLATAIAETSLTLPDIRAVVDGGRARRARFDPGSGMSRLVTERVTRAEADQRRGRAGRVGPGLCFRLWSRAEEGGLVAFPPAEIEAADLTGLALELALWGGGEGLAFLTPPPAGALTEARALLTDLGALTDGRITDHGRALAALPLHPRLGHMLLRAGAAAAPLAALLSDRDPLAGAPPDLSLRLAALDDPDRPRGPGGRLPHRPTVERIRDEARRLARSLPPRSEPAAELLPGQMAALAYPDRIGLRRPGAEPRWLLSGGKGAAMAPGLPLSESRLIVATDLDGDPREAVVRQAAALDEADLRAIFADRIAWHDSCRWSRRLGRVLARRQERLGALVLAEQPWPDAPPEALAAAALDGLRQIGLPWTTDARRLRARIDLARRDGADLPDCSDDALLASDGAWLSPQLAGLRTEADLRALDLLQALQARLGPAALRLLDTLCPAAWESPVGRRVPIDYEGAVPAVELRLQEVFGTTHHPVVGPARRPLRMTLLSPGGKPVQVTTDLPGFFATSYADVRRDLRGRYPRHPWPEDPTAAEPTLRAKPRGR